MKNTLNYAKEEEKNGAYLMMLNSFREYDYCFFTMMGKFFARKQYIKEMGCQFYSNEKMKWYILYENIMDIRGFASLEDKGKYYYLDNVYVIDKYRNKGYATRILNKIILENNDKSIKLISNNKIAINIYQKLGFKIYGTNGSYKKMIKENWK